MLPPVKDSHPPLVENEKENRVDRVDCVVPPAFQVFGGITERRREEKETEKREGQRERKREGGKEKKSERLAREMLTYHMAPTTDRQKHATQETAQWNLECGPGSGTQMTSWTKPMKSAAVPTTAREMKFPGGLSHVLLIVGRLGSAGHCFCPTQVAYVKSIVQIIVVETQRTTERTEIVKRGFIFVIINCLTPARFKPRQAALRSQIEISR